MEPNYSDYSTLELEDALADVDKNAFPKRVERRPTWHVMGKPRCNLSR
ncbi:hypothetical protein MTsDn1_14950 [Alteromonas sp. MTD1]